MFSVTQYGEPLRNYEWSKKTKIFSSPEHGLVLDFTNYKGVTFNTGNFCIFKTSSNCTFKTGSHCSFKTGFGCDFKTGDNCIFETGSDCTFDAGFSCIFKTSFNCTFKTDANSIIMRRDIFEVIQPKQGKLLKLNKFGVGGYRYFKNHIITIDGESVEISEESFNNLKKSLREKMK